MRTQQIHETEDEFMLSLLNLYFAVNPKHNDDIQDAAINANFFKAYLPNIVVVFFFFFAMNLMQLMLVKINISTTEKKQQT